jgi:hypothetical protein
LTWVQANNRWEPRPVPAAPPPPAPPTNLEEGLVRIFALSWRHNVPHDFFFMLDGRETRGLAVAFGIEQAGDARVRIGIEDPPGTASPRRLDAGSLDEYSFQVFAEVGRGNLIVERRRLVPSDIVPIRPDVAPGAAGFATGDSIPSPFPPGSPAFAPGALLVLSPNILGELRDARVYVEIHGDHVLDDGSRGDAPRAIDAEFLRGELPTGDRPANARSGLQGGRFNSWFQRSLEDVRPPFDFSRVTFDQLIANDVPRNVATGLVAFRAGRTEPVAGIEDLREVRGVGEATLRNLSRVITVSR